MLDFFKGSTDDFGQKMQISSSFPLCLFLDKMGLEIMFDGHLVQKQPMIRLD